MKGGDMTQADLEVIYDALAQAIDRVGPDKAPLFLVKLALLNAQALGAAEPFLAHIDSAGQDL